MPAQPGSNSRGVAGYPERRELEKDLATQAKIMGGGRLIQTKIMGELGSFSFGEMSSMEYC